MDLVHVSDVCSAISKAGTAEVPSSRHAVFNIGSGNPMAVHDIAKLVQGKAQKLGRPEPKITCRETQRGEWPDFGMDNRRAAARLNWHPSISVDNTINGLIRLYEQNAKS